MKKIILILLLVLTSGVLVAQESGQRVALTRKEKKDSIAESQYRLNKYMLENRNFVLVASCRTGVVIVGL